MLAFKLLPWRIIAPALGVILTLLGAYHWAHGRGQRSRDGEVAVLTKERDAAQSNADLLEAAVQHQNAAVRLAEAKGAAAQNQASQAVRMAQERDRALAGMRRRLEAAARPQAPLPGCVVPDAVKDAWGAM
jgi:hypothetical protein